MHKRQSALSATQIEELRDLVLDTNLDSAAKLLQVSRLTVSNILAGLPCHRSTVRAVKARLEELSAAPDAHGEEVPRG